MFEVQNSFVKNVWLQSQVNAGRLLLGSRLRVRYSNAGKHYVLIRWRITSSEAALPTLLNIELDER